MDLGHRVRDLRTARGLNQGELAAQATIARNTLNRIENGHLMPTAPVIEHLAEALGVDPGRLFKEPVPLAEAQTEEAGAPPQAALWRQGRTARERAPERLLEQLHAHGIRTTLSEASVLGQIVGMPDDLVEEDPVEWERLGWLAAAAATSGLFTEDEAKAARETALRELGEAGDSPHPGVEHIFMSSYGDEATQDEAWAEAREHAKEARWAHQSKVIVRDNGEAVEVFVERGVADRMRAAHERAIRDDVRRADALDRTRGRV